MLILVIEVDGRPMGMICFSLPARGTNIRYGASCWELARLWLDDALPTNAETWVIGQAIRHIKRHHPTVDVLVSYADPSAGHTGRIYVAGNWESDGRTDEERKTARFDLVTRTTDLLGEKVMRHTRAGRAHGTVERLRRISKLRFIYPLRRKLTGTIGTERR